MVIVGRPFKGTFLFEWQIGPCVFQWGHQDHFQTNGWFGTPFRVWLDSCWEQHG